MISFSVDSSGLRSIGAGALAPGAGCAAARTRARDAARSLSAMVSVYSISPSRMPSLGLVTKSTAPSSSARMVISEPRSVSDDTISTGIGRSRIRRSRKSRPSMRGISTSSVSTSGFRRLIRSRATSGSGAVPTTSMSGWLLMISVIRLRISAESSTQSTLILAAVIGIRARLGQGSWRVGDCRANSSGVRSGARAGVLAEVAMARASARSSRATETSSSCRVSRRTSASPPIGK
ncbi:hypothetical protein D9M70_407840 [compost metagenome]